MGAAVNVGVQASGIHTVLVVEDEVLVRLMIAEELRSAGFQVIEAADADEALSVLAHITDVSVIFSDIRMPGSMDGLGLATKVRADFPQIRIVLASGNPAGVTSVDHDGFFLKPYEADKIINLIKTLLDQKSPGEQSPGEQ
jgi:CheY-like chemotaxis protein